MKIATWNVNSLKVRLPQVLDWLKQQSPDVLVLQELKLEHHQFPEEAFRNEGFQAAWNGQKTYNGVAIISKHPIEDVQADMPAFADEQKRVIAASINGIRIVDVYCVNGEAIDSDKYIYKQHWFTALQHYMQQVLAQHENTVLLGDFNIAPTDIDVYDPEKWRGKILCSAAERQWFQNLLDLGLTDSLRLINPDAPNFTWWDYRMNMFRRKLGLRIDHILTSPALTVRLKEAAVDTAPRGWERPSDHAPVYAVFG
ncbi:exodeoxyribonuclease III [Stenoxybacter acetivorans]|uniref:exodeoxyribonuclease III n=1 Tax=Stenoxybacter acetivorans TaxID=422441 RepID=UPI00055B8AEC|nr:exodeoxyribonuclease III [Stenoxybacter acetivorans]